MEDEQILSLEYGETGGSLCDPLENFGLPNMCILAL